MSGTTCVDPRVGRLARGLGYRTVQPDADMASKVARSEQSRNRWQVGSAKTCLRFQTLQSERIILSRSINRNISSKNRQLKSIGESFRRFRQDHEDHQRPAPNAGRTWRSAGIRRHRLWPKHQDHNPFTSLPLENTRSLTIDSRVIPAYPSRVLLLPYLDDSPCAAPNPLPWLALSRDGCHTIVCRLAARLPTVSPSEVFLSSTSIRVLFVAVLP